MKPKRLSACLFIALITFIFAISVNPIPVQAETSFSGVISSDITWTLANNPYTLTWNVLVSQGIILTIEPGVTVNLNSYYIKVDGTLNAQGTNGNKISFIRADASSNFNDQPGIQFTSKSSPWNETTKTGCIISHALVTCSLQGSANTIKISSASPKICDCTIINTSFQRGIWVEDGDPMIVNNSISSNFAGITVVGGIGGIMNYLRKNCTIANNTIFNCEVGIEVYSGNPLIERNLIINNTGSKNSGGGGIRLDYYNTNATIKNNTIVLNSIGLNFLENANATILFNNIQNIEYNIYLYPPQSTGNINATYNWWGTTDNDAVKQSMYDFKDDFNLGNVYTTPLLSAPNIQAPIYINASTGAGGSISSRGITKLNYGDSQTFAIAPDTGYHIADVLVNGSSIGAVTSFTVQNIGGATTISATFAVDPTPTPPSQPTTNPTANPTTSPTQTPASSPTPTPSIPEFPAIAAIVILIGSMMMLLLLKKKGYVPSLLFF